MPFTWSRLGFAGYVGGVGFAIICMAYWLGVRSGAGSMQAALDTERALYATAQDELASARVDGEAAYARGLHEGLSRGNISPSASNAVLCACATEIVGMEEIPSSLGDGCRYFVCTVRGADGIERQSAHKAQVNFFEAAFLNALKAKFGRGMREDPAAHANARP